MPSTEVKAYIYIYVMHSAMILCSFAAFIYIYLLYIYDYMYKHNISPSYCRCQDWKPTTSPTSEISTPTDGGHAASADGLGSSLGDNQENSHQDSPILGQQLVFPDDDFEKELETMVTGLENCLEVPLPGPTIPQILSPHCSPERKDSPHVDSQASTVAADGGEELPLNDQLHSDGTMNGTFHQIAPPNTPALKSSQGCQDGRVPKEFL